MNRPQIYEYASMRNFYFILFYLEVIITLIGETKFTKFTILDDCKILELTRMLQKGVHS